MSTSKRKCEDDANVNGDQPNKNPKLEEKKEKNDDEKTRRIAIIQSPELKKLVSNLVNDSKKNSWANECYDWTKAEEYIYDRLVGYFINGVIDNQWPASFNDENDEIEERWNKFCGGAMNKIKKYILGFNSGHDHRYNVEDTGYYERIERAVREFVESVRELLVE